MPWDRFITWKKSGGNVLLQYDSTVTQDDILHGLKINHSSFLYGKNYQYCSNGDWHPKCGGAGIAIIIKPPSPGPLPKLSIILENSIFYDNVAQHGAHLVVIQDEKRRPYKKDYYQ